MNCRETVKEPCCIKEVVVSKQENRFTPHIICTDDILCCEKSSPCQLEVKASKDMYPTKMITPDMVVVVVVAGGRKALGEIQNNYMAPHIRTHMDGISNFWNDYIYTFCVR